MTKSGKTGKPKATPVKRTVGAKKVAPRGKAKTDTNTNTIPEEMIRARAYEIYLRRMQYCRPGDAQTDWQQAENELRADRRKKK